MAERYCGNCGHGLKQDDRFCPSCGKPVFETARVPTPEADVPVPPLPQQNVEATPLLAEQAEPPPESKPNNVVEAFKQTNTSVKLVLGVAVLVGILGIANQSAFGLVLMLAFLLLGAHLLHTQENSSGGAAGQVVINETEVEPAEPISEAQRTRLLDEAIGGYLLNGFFVRLRTPTTAQLVRPKKFSFLWAFLWFLLFGIGIIIYLIYYAAKRDEGFYLQVDEYGNVTATRQLR